MASLSASRKAELAEQLRVVASWVEGPRKTKVLAIANELEGLDEDESHDQASKDAAALAGQGGPPTGTPDPDLAEARRGKKD